MAESLFKRCRTIREKILGPDHPDVTLTLYLQAEELRNQVTAVRFLEEVSGDQLMA